MSATLGFYFRNAWYARDTRLDAPRISLEDYAFPAFLTVPLKGDDLEIPVCVIPRFFMARSLGYDKLVLNLVDGTDHMDRRTFHHKTATTIFRKFAEASTTAGTRIAHVVTNSDLHYYGNRSIIMDANRNLIMMATVHIHFDSSSRFVVTDPICHLSYKMFENSGNIVEKTIIKYGIPAWAGREVEMHIYGHYYYGKPRIVIDHYDNVITKPVVPKISEISTEHFNELILDTHVD